MTTATGAVIFGALHKKFVVGFGFDVAFDLVEEAGPAGAAVEFLLRGEQIEVASGADEFSGAVFVEQGAGEGAFGAFFAQDIELFGGQHLFPLLFAVGHFFDCLGEGPWHEAEERQRARAAEQVFKEDAAVHEVGLLAGKWRERGLDQSLYHAPAPSPTCGLRGFFARAVWACVTQNNVTVCFLYIKIYVIIFVSDTFVQQLTRETYKRYKGLHLKC